MDHWGFERRRQPRARWQNAKDPWRGKDRTGARESVRNPGWLALPAPTGSGPARAFARRAGDSGLGQPHRPPAPAWSRRRKPSVPSATSICPSSRAWCRRATSCAAETCVPVGKQSGARRRHSSDRRGSGHLTHPYGDASSGQILRERCQKGRERPARALSRYRLAVGLTRVRRRQSG